MAVDETAAETERAAADDSVATVGGGTTDPDAADTADPVDVDKVTAETDAADKDATDEHATDADVADAAIAGTDATGMDNAGTDAVDGSGAGDEAAGEAPPPEVPAPPARRRGPVRRAAAVVATSLAGLLVLFALLVPNQLSAVKTGAFVRIPAEALMGVALVLILPPMLRRVAAWIVGVGLAALTLLKFLDMGFYQILDRQFNVVGDWGLTGDTVESVGRSFGRAGEIAGVVGALLLIVAVVVLMIWSALRLTRATVRHRNTSLGALGVFGIAWVMCYVLGVQLFPGIPVASRSAGTLAYHHARQVPQALRDQRLFATEVKNDPFRTTPGDQLLTGLRGKDVMLTFVESYGRVALQDPQYAAQTDALLDAGYARLRAAGFSARSGWLTSPTFGGGSWLAHSTMLSGLWINNQQLYHDLMASSRFTLNSAFQRAGWRTVGVEAAVTRSWPEGAFYKYQRLYTMQNMGYNGPHYNFGSMPDQYTLSTFQHNERSAPGHAPVMTEMVLLSSHEPWAPLPPLLDWNSIGDGSVYNGKHQPGPTSKAVLGDRTTARSAYIQAIDYSLSSLISYVETYGGKNLVLVFLGDHQPAPEISGDGASRDVPITIVAHDPSVLDRIASWNWQDGLRPGAQTPVWPMNSFRDRFLTAFGPQPQGGPAPSASAPSH